MIRRIDDFLIDRVFQPVADVSSRWCSCYGIAAFLFTGFALEQFVYRFYLRDWLWMALGLTWIPKRVWDAYKAELRPIRDVMPIDRISNFIVRVVFVVFLIPTTVIAVAEAKDAMKTVAEISWIFLIIGEYFMACRPRPPRRNLAKNVENLAAIRT